MSEFAQKLLGIALAQILLDNGYESSSHSASSVLLDVAERYINLLASLCIQYAHNSDRNQVCCLDLEKALQDVSNSPKNLLVFWNQFGIRIPTSKETNDRTTIGSGNAILEAILGIQKQTQVIVKEEKSGFFRYEPGSFPVDVYELSQKEYTFPLQKVPDDEESRLKRLDEQVQLKQNPFAAPKPFHESEYYEGNSAEYRDPIHTITSPMTSNRTFREKWLSKSRKLFEKAFHASLEFNKTPSKPSEMILPFHYIQKIMIEKQRFSICIPEVGNYEFDPGFMSDLHTTAIPELTGSKRPLPVFKDDKREIKKEMKALGLKFDPKNLAATLANLASVETLHSIVNSSSTASMEEIQQKLKAQLAKDKLAKTQPSFIKSGTPPPPPSSVPMPSSSGVLNESPKPKLKFKLNKVSLSPLKESTVPFPYSMPSIVPMIPIQNSNSSNSTDLIQCICPNASIDYGLFMIACDTCG